MVRVGALVETGGALVMTFRHVRKVFGRQVAVDDFTLEVRRGEVLALLGPNGSGKTTTLKVAAGLIQPTAGQVLIGEHARPASEARARRHIAFLPQRVAFPDGLTGLEVIEFYRRLRGAPAARSRDVLRFASLNGAGDRAVGTYSGGMVQRLGLAVTLLPNAPVLLLDEPTAALDPDGLTAFYDVIERHAQDGRTVLFTSHQLGDVGRLADRFAVMVGGRLMAVLTQRELHDRLAERGIMRLRLDGCPDALLTRVREMAPATTWRSDELTVPGSAASRPAVLECVHRAGVGVRSMTTEEGRLDSLYRELVGGAS